MRDPVVREQSTQPGGSHSATDPIEINLRNLEYWIRSTVRNERTHDTGRTRTLSAKKLVRLVRPNLRDPVFAIGAPRSGTTFLGDCLAQLPELSYHFEPVLTKAAVRCIYDEIWSYRKARWIYRSTYAWLMRRRMETDLRFCEKTPGNCFIMPFLDRAFDSARFIHIVRDGRDAALSLSKKPWYRSDSGQSGIRDPDGYLIGPSSRFWVETHRTSEYEAATDLHRCIWLWRRYVESALADAKSISPHQYLQIKYEELLTNPGEYAESISDFLGIDNSQSRAVFRSRMIEKARVDSIGRWREEIDEAELLKMEREAEPVLKELGYPLGDGSVT